MKLEAVKIVSAPTLENWSQVHVFIPEGEEKLQKRGQIFAVFSLKMLGSEEEIASAGKEFISRLHEEYYGFLGETPFKQLKRAEEIVAREISPEAEVEIIAGVMVDGVIYLAAIGEGKVVLKRGKDVVTLLQGQKGSVLTASGYFQPGDLFILGTKKFFEIVPQEVIQPALASNLAQQVGEILTPLVLSKEEGLASAVIIEIKEEREKREMVFIKKNKEKTERGKKIADFFLKIKQKIIEPPVKKPKKSYFTVALILLLVLGISMVFGSKERKRQEKEKRVELVLEEVKTKKEEGEAILGLNPAKAREILKEAESLLEEAEKEKISSLKLEKVKEELKNSLNSVLKEYEVEVKLFFDLELIKKEAVGNDFVLADDQFVILDNQSLAIYRVGITDKKSEILAGGEELRNSLGLVSFGNKIYILTPQGVLEGKLKTQNEKLKIVVEKDKDWEEVRDLAVFAGNLYLLDKGEIWVYPASAEGFGGKKSWLKNPADFSQTEEMVINGAIWILKKDGGIEKYLRGSKEIFGVQGLDKPFLEPAGLYTSPDEEKLYILDRGNSRVVVLNKNGQYDAQYKNSQVANVQNLVVWEKEGKMFLLAGSKIYEITLK